MSKIKYSTTELIGGTPLLSLRNYQKKKGVTGAEIVAKLEFLNPAGSAKDRVALGMIEDAEKRGLIKPGATIIEPTSGNTGIGLACVAAAKGYKTILTLPDTMSVERRTLLKAYGAEIVLSEGALGMEGAIRKAEELRDSIPGSVILGQFDNPANPQSHYDTTGPEIWEDTDGELDIFVATVGTGGTLTGTAKYLKEKNPAISVIAVEPEGSAVLSGKKPGPHKLQGIGAGFIPSILDTKIYDEVIAVPDDAAFEEGRALAHAEGILTGISSGAALWAAVQAASRPENKGKRIVVLLPDLKSESGISHQIFVESGLGGVRVTVHPQTCYTKRNQAEYIQRDKTDIESEQPGEMSADQPGASPDQFTRTVVGKIEEQVSTYRVTDTDCYSSQNSCPDQENGYYS